MEKPTKRKVPAAGDAKASGVPSKRVADRSSPAASTRYTPPTDPSFMGPSPLWVPILMFACLGLGLVVILLNYVDLVPGGTSPWYLVGGLGLVLVGILTATQYR